MPPKGPRTERRGGTNQHPHPHTRYCFTLNEVTLPKLLDRCKLATITRNPDDSIQGLQWNTADEALETAMVSLFKYFICQLEKTPTTGTPHLQGYFELKESASIITMKEKLDPIFGGAKTYVHYEEARGTREQNFQYCSKEETRWVETIPFFYEQDDAAETTGDEDCEFQYIMQHIRKFSTIKQILDGIPGETKIPLKRRAGVMWKVISQAKSIIQITNFYKSTEIPLYRPVDIWVIWGDSGIGKTWDVLHPPPEAGYKAEDVYRRTLSLGPWWDGYNGEKVLVLDDFGCPDGKGQFPIAPGEMLDIMQGYQHRVQVKGSVVQGSWIKVFIISNIEPTHWYRDWIMVDPAVKQAFFDRIPPTQIIHKVGRSMRNNEAAVAAHVAERERMNNNNNRGRTVDELLFE